MDGSEARVDLVLIQTPLLLSCKCTLLKSEQLVLHNKRSEVRIKTRSILASLPSKGQVTKQTTVKWSIEIHVLTKSVDSQLWPYYDDDNETTYLSSKARFPLCRVCRMIFSCTFFACIFDVVCKSKGLT